MTKLLNNVTPSIDELDFVEREQLRKSKPSPLAIAGFDELEDELEEEPDGYDDDLYDPTYQ